MSLSSVGQQQFFDRISFICRKHGPAIESIAHKLVSIAEELDRIPLNDQNYRRVEAKLQLRALTDVLLLDTVRIEDVNVMIDNCRDLVRRARRSAIVLLMMELNEEELEEVDTNRTGVKRNRKRKSEEKSGAATVAKKRIRRSLDEETNDSDDEAVLLKDEVVTPRAEMYEIGDRILCEHLGFFYDAKVTRAVITNEDIEYRVHFIGWKNIHDEIVPHSETGKRFKIYNNSNYKRAIEERKRAERRRSKTKRFTPSPLRENRCSSPLTV